MAESAEARIQRMNLSTLPTPATDEFIDDDDYAKRSELYDFIKASNITENKPVGDAAWIEVAEDTSDADYIPCHLPVPIMKWTHITKESTFSLM